MAYEYKKYRHVNDPKWVGKLAKYQEDDAEAGDTKAVIRNYDSDPRITREASYVKKGK